MADTTQSTSTQPIRGTIIVDASALFGLCGNVSRTLSADGLKPQNYLDLLPLLSQQGYRILIPEMVAYESGWWVVDYGSTHKLFPHSKYYEQTKIFQDLFREVNRAEKTHSNMEIVRSTGPSEVDYLLQGIRTALDGSKVPYAVKQQDKASYHRRLVSAVERNTDRTNFGEKAVLAMLKNPERYKLGWNTAVLTDDFELIKNINSHHPGAETVKSNQLVYALGASGVSRAIGFTKAIDPLTLAHNQIKSSANSAGDDNQRIQEKLAEVRHITKGNSRLFADLSALAAELTKKNPPATEPRPAGSSQRIPAAKSGLERFNKRWTGNKGDGDKRR